ncbi:MAG: glycosyltransferase [Candidatus Promineofilum sp.]|nr:glycosyltransferase [Promineifilum sp.]
MATNGASAPIRHTPMRAAELPARPTPTPDDAPAIELTVIVPTRNEAGNVAPLLDRLGEALAGHAFEVLFMDDSTDATPQIIAAETAVRLFPVRVIARPPARRNGLSGAVVEGMAAAAGRWLCVIDADLQHPPELIPRLLAQANRTAADIVVASRQADWLGPVGLSRARALTSQILTILARMVFPRVLKNVSDPLTGFFLARRAAVDATTLQPEGFKILLELLVRHPDLRVTELHFDFAPRHEGQSKADLNEGMRFFRHLTRLRLTVNQHLIRFLVLVALLVAGNLALLVGLAAGAGWPVLRAAAVAGGATIVAVLLGEAWVFSDRPRGPARRRLVALLLLGTLFLLLIYLPAIWLLAVRLGAPYPLAGLAAMLLAGLAYYALSEQWIWTRGLMMRPRASTTYDIHGIVTVASQVPLDDLAHFQTTAPPPRIDLQLRVDRHGTPSRVPGAICYDEHLGRFGFGLTVMPGDFTEIVVSPLLETSPAFLYTNVVEPVLRWLLLTRGYALPRAGGVVEVEGGRAVLLSGPTDLGYGLGRLCADGRLAFLGDDRVLLGRDGRARRFPKPVTARGEMRLPGGAARAAVALRLQRLLYSRPVRRLGLWLSERRLPAATVNTTLQRLIPQPKHSLGALVPGVVYGDAAVPALLLLPEADSVTLAAAVARLLDEGDTAFGFQPYPLLLGELARWGGRDWAVEERAIVTAALAGCERIPWRPDERWWEQVEQAIDSSPTNKRLDHALTPHAV